MKARPAYKYAFSPPGVSGIEKWQIRTYHRDIISDAGKYELEKKAFLETQTGKKFLTYRQEKFLNLNGLSLWLVDGTSLRGGAKAGDVDFTMAGHGFRYLYIPLGEIWIDAVYKNTLDFWPTIWHEYLERNLMAKGMDYDNAHDIAHRLEIVLRQGKYFVLPVGTYRQSNILNCGPAALKIVLDYYNRSYSEKRLVALLGTNQKGTEPQAFLKVAKHLGFKAKSRENMTVVLVKRLIKQGLPVIANHTTPDPTGGHYAVIIGFSQDEFVLSDPAEDSGYIIKKINYFMDNWYEEEDKTVRQGITIGL